MPKIFAVESVDLLQCWVRVDRVVPQKGSEPFKLTWREMLQHFVKDPSKRVTTGAALRKLRFGNFVGLVRPPPGAGDAVRNFVLQNNGGSNQINWLLKSDPSFADRVVEIYRVEKVEFSGGIEEMPAVSLVS